MSGTSWWAESLRAELSQGDIVADLPFAFFRHPLTHLKQIAVRKHPLVWEPSAVPQLSTATQTHYALAGCSISHGVIVSHDCAIDKKSGQSRVLAAPVVDVGTLDSATRQSVRDQRHLSMMYLGEVPMLGEGYADLRLISPITRELIDRGARQASMSNAGRERLGAQLLTFFVDRGANGNE